MFGFILNEDLHCQAEIGERSVCLRRITGKIIDVIERQPILGNNYFTVYRG